MVRQYCEHYTRYRGSLARSMRQVHRAGENVHRLSGDTAAVIDMDHRRGARRADLVAVMGASKYAYSGSDWTQTLRTGSPRNIRALEFMNGAPALLHSDH